MKIARLQKKHQTFNSDQAKSCGVTPSLLTYYLKKGRVERISHGLYCFPEYSTIDLDSLIREKLKIIPQGIEIGGTRRRLKGSKAWHRVLLDKDFQGIMEEARKRNFPKLEVPAIPKLFKEVSDYLKTFEPWK